jgi:hypothetical protein
VNLVGFIIRIYHDARSPPECLKMTGRIRLHMKFKDLGSKQSSPDSSFFTPAFGF